MPLMASSLNTEKLQKVRKGHMHDVDIGREGERKRERERERERERIT